MTQHNDATPPFRVEGTVLSAVSYDAIATITDEDTKKAVEQWRRIVPVRYERILEAEET